MVETLNVLLEKLEETGSGWGAEFGAGAGADIEADADIGSHSRQGRQQQCQ